MNSVLPQQTHNEALSPAENFSSQGERKKEWPVYRMFCKTENISLQQTAGSENFTSLTRKPDFSPGHLHITYFKLGRIMFPFSHSVPASVFSGYTLCRMSVAFGDFSVLDYAYNSLLTLRFA